MNNLLNNFIVVQKNKIVRSKIKTCINKQKANISLFFYQQAKYKRIPLKVSLKNRKQTFECKFCIYIYEEKRLLVISYLNNKAKVNKFIQKHK